MNEEHPFVAGQVPVDLAHAAGVHSDDCGGEIGGDREGCGVNDFDGATGDTVCGLLGEVVGVALGAGDEAGKSGYVLFGDA